MTTFTREQLIEHAQKHIEHAAWMKGKFPDAYKTPATVELARIALAAMQQGPVSFDVLNETVAEVTGGNLHSWNLALYKGHHPVPFINYNSLSRIVEKFRAAPQPAPVVPDGWISCSEKMPGKGERVLVFVDFDSSAVTPLAKDAEYTGSTFRIGPNTVNTTGEPRVTHWMPLPAQPQQEVM